MKCEKPREGWGERASRRFSPHVRFFRSTERDPSTSYDPDNPFSGESRTHPKLHSSLFPTSFSFPFGICAQILVNPASRIAVRSRTISEFS